jgi:hypothetical protein
MSRTRPRPHASPDANFPITSEERHVNGSTLQLAGCPQCLAPAEITDRFVLQSTSGPVEHITVCCLRRHRFTTTVDHLPSVAHRTEPGRWAPASS